MVSHPSYGDGHEHECVYGHEQVYATRMKETIGLDRRKEGKRTEMDNF
jgi:hypothetical protein